MRAAVCRVKTLPTILFTAGRDFSQPPVAASVKTSESPDQPRSWAHGCPSCRCKQRWPSDCSGRFKEGGEKNEHLRAKRRRGGPPDYSVVSAIPLHKALMFNAVFHSVSTSSRDREASFLPSPSLSHTHTHWRKRQPFSVLIRVTVLLGNNLVRIKQISLFFFFQNRYCF